MPLEAKRFLEAVRTRLEPLRGTRVYEPIQRDILAKTEQVDAGYARWLGQLLPYLVSECGVRGTPKILDFGCGLGELTVLMNTLGYETVGIDLHEEHLELARLLARENGIPESRFVLHDGGRLPFQDKAFDLVTLFVVLEHLSDDVLERVLPELARVCSGGIFVQVPNRFQTKDDHTALRLVPWMPRRMAEWYVRLRGSSHRYAISRDETWDVHYRTYASIRRRLERHGLGVRFVRDELVYPPLDVAKPLFPLEGKPPWKRAVFALVRVGAQLLARERAPRQAWYPYLNLLVTAPASATSSR